MSYFTVRYNRIALKGKAETLSPFSVVADGASRPSFIWRGMAKKYNPRMANGNRRRKYRARFKAMGAPCGICKGRLGEIHYDEPSDAQHPLSFVIDEIKPVSRWNEFGYSSARQCAEDWSNLQAAHWICNSRKSNKTSYGVITIKNVTQDGAW